MHYDRGCKCTQGLLLADYLKALITGNRLPDDLAAQAVGSPLLRAAPRGQVLRGTLFGEAFLQQAPLTAVAAAPTPAPTAAPTSTPAPAPVTIAAPVSVSSP